MPFSIPAFVTRRVRPLRAALKAAPWPAVSAAAGLFLYLTWFRTAGISRHFQLLGDQIRDWTIALGPVRDLPLTGPPSMAGGRALGPIYYWLLWLSRVTIGPFVDNLPHAGGIGLSLLQSLADVVLVRALWERLGSRPAAVAVVLLVATSPFDAAVTASVWNPQVAVAFSKLAIALALTSWPGWTRGRQAGTVALAWLAVQGHSSAAPVASAIIGWVVVRHWWAGRRTDSLRAAVDAALVILLLQIPFVVHLLIYGTGHGSGPSRALGAFAGLAGGFVVQLVASASAASSYLSSTLFDPWGTTWLGLGLAVSAASVLITTRAGTAEWAVVSVLPLVLAIALYLPFPDRRDYWYLALAPGAGVMIGRALAVAGRARAGLRWAGALFLVAVLVGQPARFRYSQQVGRFPQYDAMVKGARQILQSGKRPRSVTASFPIDTSDPEFVYKVLGGQLDPESGLDAQILPGGGVLYREGGR